MKKLPALLCLLFCLWCGASALSTWPAAGTAAADAALFVPAVAPSPSPAAEQLVAADGPIAFHEEPQVSLSPEPGREWYPVEELTLSGGRQVADFQVRDTTDSGTDLLEELAALPPIAPAGDGRIEILIYHTHTSEAYARHDAGFYYSDDETRTGDTDRSVVAAGEALKAALEARGYGVVHDTTVCDELFNGSYARSWEVIRKNLETYPDICVTVDVHRDSMLAENGVKYKPTVTVNGRKAAQIMLVAGCDADGGWGDFPNWRDNLRLMLRLQEQAALRYPGLMRPMSFSNCKYNMNATSGSMLAEIGTEVNTAAEARYAGRLLGELLADTLDSLRE